MSRLNLQDHMFIKIEQGGLTPMYMGGAYIVDPSHSPYPLDVDTLAEHLAAVMQELPLMRQKLVQDVLRIGNMHLVDDPDFNVRNHIRVVHLEEPGGYDELTGHLEEFSLRRMKLDRPLWHFDVIAGLEGDRIALAMHLHHSVLDGVGASRVMASIWSSKPTKARTPGDKSWPKAQLSTPGKMLGGAILENVKRLSVDPPGFALKNTGPIVNTVRAEIDKWLSGDENEHAETKVELPPIQKTSLNVGRLSNKRAVAYMELPFAEIKSLRKNFDCTVNDLALFVSSCALEHYFDAIGETVDFDLVCSIALNTRAEGDQRAGNSVGAARVNLHNTVEDAAQRLAAITRDTRVIKQNAAKARGENSDESAIDYEALANLFSPILLEAAVYGVKRFNLLDKIPLLANVTITNVPYSLEPMYLAGAKLVSGVPMAPCGDTIALTINVTNVEDTLLIGFHGCGEAVRDKALFVEGGRFGLAALKRKRKASSVSNHSRTSKGKSATAGKKTRRKAGAKKIS